MLLCFPLVLVHSSQIASIPDTGVTGLWFVPNTLHTCHWEAVPPSVIYRSVFRWEVRSVTFCVNRPFRASKTMISLFFRRARGLLSLNYRIHLIMSSSVSHPFSLHFNNFTRKYFVWMVSVSYHQPELKISVILAFLSCSFSGTDFDSFIINNSVGEHTKRYWGFII